MSVDDVSSQLASIRNALEKGKFLQVTTKLVELKKLLKEFGKESMVDSLIHNVAEVSTRHKDEQRFDLIEKKLDEIDVVISGYRQL